MSRETDVRAWLKYAGADRRSAYNAMAAADYRDVAFHCQHNLWRLWQRISGVACPQDVQEALAALNPHYFLSRYPGLGIEYDLTAAQELVERMERVWQWLTRTANLLGE